MNVLVDTSVWIRFLADREPQAAELERLLGRDEVVAHELVQGELLLGDTGGRAPLLDAYALMLQAPVIRHAEVLELVHARRLQGRGVGWIDVHLLASALVGGLSLWTVDARLGTLAVELGVAHNA